MRVEKNIQSQRRTTAIGLSMILAALFLPEIAFAEAAGGGALAVNAGNIATAVTSNFKAIAQLITATAYIGGLGFAVGSILKFKQHKDNPTQIPIGTPVAMLFVAAAMLFFPTILGITGQTVFGGEGTVGGPTGVVFGASAAAT